ncbi:unnamed protein product [Cochlearia groenlandica]
MIKVGPVGAKEPNDKHWDEQGKTMVSHIFVSYDTTSIRSIQFGYSEKGSMVLSEKYGDSSQGHNFQVIKLKHNEYVTGLCGVASSGFNNEGIVSLTINTNLGKHVLISDPERALSYNCSRTKKEINIGISDRREFGGFFGTCNASYLKSIGIYMNPVAISNGGVKGEQF